MRIVLSLQKNYLFSCFLHDDDDDRDDYDTIREGKGILSGSVFRIHLRILQTLSVHSVGGSSLFFPY